MAAAWSSIVTDVDAQRAPLTVRGRTEALVLDVLRYPFGNRVQAGDEEVDGLIEVELRAQSELMVARQLAGFADA
jgi:hypothetical protein